MFVAISSLAQANVTSIARPMPQTVLYVYRASICMSYYGHTYFLHMHSLIIPLFRYSMFRVLWIPTYITLLVLEHQNIYCTVLLIHTSM